MNPPPPDFKVRNAEIEQTLKALGREIHTLVPAGWGFTLLLFTLHDEGDGALFYISSAQRDDMCKAMREFLAKQEGAVQ